MTLRTQIAGGFAALLIVSLAAFGALYWAIDRVQTEMTRVIDDRMPKVLAANDIIKAVSRNYIMTANLIGLADGKSDEPFKAEMKATSATISERFKLLEARVTDDDGKAMVANAQVVRKAYTDSRAKALEMAAKGDIDGARRHLAAETNGRRARYQESIDLLIQHQTALTHAAAGEAGRAHGMAAVIAAGSAALLAAATATLFVFLLSTLRRELGGEPADARRFAAQIAAGRLDAQPPAGSGGTHSVMASLVTMRNALAALIAEISGSAHAVRCSADEAQKTSAHLATLVSRQSQETAAIAASVEQMTVNVRQISDSARAAESASLGAHGAAEQGGQSIREGLVRMSRIGDSVRSAEHAMSELGTRALDISKVVEVIRDIADQTNLLALNAAIEAARAGEAGRGFAVVADEVRGLAERTSRSTSEITTVVDSIQSVARATQERMAAMVANVHDEETSSAEVSGVIARMSDASASVSQAVTEMSGALAEQSAGSRSIAGKIAEIAQMNENSDAAAQALSALSKTLGDLSARLDRSSSAFSI